MRIRPGSDAWRERYGPWAVITGASSGIGEAIARQVAAAGLNVVLVARGAERLRALGSELEARQSARTVVVPADLATPAGLAAVEAATTLLDISFASSTRLNRSHSFRAPNSP